ncbi:MAG: hypothetical protein E2O39_01710, partial [Planctomycetota bacterium]
MPVSGSSRCTRAALGAPPAWSGRGGADVVWEARGPSFLCAGTSCARNSASTAATGAPSRGGGPIAVIVDATVRSAGETSSGIFGEDGRAHMIGESDTGGWRPRRRRSSCRRDSSHCESRA